MSLDEKNEMIGGRGVSAFTRNTLIISQGAIASQALMVVATPMLTRLYRPEDFGRLALFSSLYAVLAGLFSLKFELAIILPKEDGTAVQVMKLGLLCSLFFSLCLMIGIASHALCAERPIAGYFLLLPIVTFVGVAYSVLQQWFSRKLQFGLSARSGVVNSAVNITACVLLFRADVIQSARLVVSYCLGFAAGALYLLAAFRRLYSGSLGKDSPSLPAVFREYAHFPRFMAPTAMLGVLSYQVIPMLLARYFTLDEVGYYSIANRFLFLPSIVVGGAIAEVFRVELARRSNQGRNLQPFFAATLKKVLIVGSPMFLIAFLMSPTVFGWMLGPSYRAAGVYAQYLCVGSFSQFLMQPFNYVYVVQRRMGLYLLVQLLLVLSPVISIMGGALVSGSIHVSLIALSVCGFATACFSLSAAHRSLKATRPGGCRSEIVQES